MSAVGLTIVAALGGIALAGGSQQEATRIEPKADQYLKAMSSYLAGLKTGSHVGRLWAVLAAQAGCGPLAG